MNTREIVTTLKENEQDFEWYPTTDGMILSVLRHIPENAGSVLDIGAGNGKVLQRFAEKCKHARLYSIEKSPILAQEQPREIIPVGVDLYEQNLSCLEVEYIFCNPPYSDYDTWTSKIIEEGYAKKAFLVIPQRWKDSQIIKKSLDLRGATARVLYSDDFSDAERRARAVVDIVEISYPGKDTYYGHGNNVKDPFDIWFDNNIDTFDHAEELKEPETSEQLARRFSHANIAEMVAAYRQEYGIMEKNYRAIFELDYQILKELGIDKAHVRDGLKEKMEGLKNKYWRTLFKRLDAITSRLTTKSSEKLLQKLTGNTSVEFTESNAYAVVIWAIKNANQYFDDQLTDLFFELSTFEGSQNYKSNTKTWVKDGWRYNRNRTHTHYKLDYRIVVSEWKAIKNEPYNSYEYPGELHKNCHNLLADITAVFSNLGFKTWSSSSYNREWESGKWQDFYGEDEEILFQAKAFKNGNIHLRFMPDAIKALNIETARLLKWVRSTDEIVKEMGYTREDAEKYYFANAHLSPANLPLLNA